MLPKPEKIRKSASNAEQLDLVDTLSHDKKVKNKRRFVLLFLILTVGLSIGFWTYHFFKTFTFKNPISNFSFSLPQINLNNTKASQTDFDKNIQSVISADPNTWSIFIYSVNPGNKTFTYEKNASEISSNYSSIVNSLSAQKYSSQSSLMKALPQGTKIQEIVDKQKESISQESLITIPHQNILFYFKISGSNLDQSEKLIPTLVEKIYWQLMDLNQ